MVAAPKIADPMTNEVSCLLTTSTVDYLSAVRRAFRPGIGLVATSTGYFARADRDCADKCTSAPCNLERQDTEIEIHAVERAMQVIGGISICEKCAPTDARVGPSRQIATVPRRIARSKTWTAYESASTKEAT